MLDFRSASIRKSIKSLLWFASISIGTLLPAAFYLATDHTIVWRDTSKLFQPIRTLVVEALRNFQLPLWNPYEALGIPLFAQMMHGVLHPVSLIGVFLFPDAGMDLFILIHFMLAAIGNALLARVFGASPGAAAVAGFGYGLSGYLLGMSSIIQYLGAAAVAPWVLAAFRIAGEGRSYGILAVAVACSVQWFSGDPQWTIIALLLGVALATEAGGIRGVRSAFTGVLVGTAVAAIQLLPTLCYLRESSRGVELDVFDRIQWAFSPWRLLEFISPGFFGNASMGLEKWPVYMWLGGLIRSGFEMPFLPSVYVGAAVLVLATAGVFQSRLTRILFISSLILLWLAFGFNAGAEQVLRHIPVWGKFRYAEKMVGPLTLCLSLLAAFGAERLSHRPSRFWVVLAGVGGVMSILLAFLFMNWQGFEAGFTGIASREAAFQARHNLATGLIHAGLSLTALAALVAGACRWPGFRPWFPAAAAGLLFLQLSLASPFAMHAGERKALDEAPLAQLRNGGEHVRILTPIEKNFLYPHDLDDDDGQIAVQSHMGAPAYNVLSRIDQFNTYTGLVPQRFELLTRAFSQQLGVRSVLALRRYAVTHEIIKNPYFADEVEIAQVASAGGTKVLESAEWGFTAWQVPHRQWAAFAGNVIHVTGENDALDELVQSIDRGESTTVLEGAAPAGGPVSGQVLKVERRSDYLRIEAVATGNGILVINDSYWPGWKAAIDGREVPVWRADFLVRAVPWPSGRHVLEMKYEPLELRIGGFVSLGGIAACVALAAIEWRRKRFSQRHGPA